MPISERMRAQAFCFSLLLSAMVLRVLVGLFRPDLGLEQTLLVGLMPVIFLGPSLYKAFFGEELLQRPRQRLSHGLSMALSAGLFLGYVAFTG